MANDLELIVESYADQLQALNDAAIDLLGKVSLDGAAGVQLDGLGQIVGIERQGLGDDAYRAALKAWIRVNTSGGTIEQLNDIVRLATSTSEADEAFFIDESFPAGFLVDFQEILTAAVAQVTAEAIRQGRAGGVYAVFKYHLTEPIFAFDGAGGSKFDGGFYLKAAVS